MRLLLSVITVSLFLLSACATIPTKDISITTDADFIFGQFILVFLLLVIG